LESLPVEHVIFLLIFILIVYDRKLIQPIALIMASPRPRTLSGIHGSGLGRPQCRMLVCIAHLCGPSLGSGSKTHGLALLRLLLELLDASLELVVLLTFLLVVSVVLCSLAAQHLHLRLQACN
jgi:hypothetical protein